MCCEKNKILKKKYCCRSSLNEEMGFFKTFKSFALAKNKRNECFKKNRLFHHITKKWGFLKQSIRSREKRNECFKKNPFFPHTVSHI